MYIYRLLDKGKNILYIGQTNDLKIRMNQHSTDKDWFKDVHKFEYAVCKDKFEVDTYEKYYIAIYKPRYNKEYMKYLAPRFKLPSIRFNLYNIVIDKKKKEKNKNFISVSFYFGKKLKQIRFKNNLKERIDKRIKILKIDNLIPNIRYFEYLKHLIEKDLNRFGETLKS